MDLTGWPPGMRVIVHKEHPHPGAQLRITDPDGNRCTAFATNTVRGQLADLELRHRHRARCEDRIRVVRLPRKGMSSFLHRSEGLVRAGSENNHLDWESELALLTGDRPAT